VLYSFCSARGCADGRDPSASLIFDAAGNLYGTTAHGGAYTKCSVGCGIVFELTPGTNGWTEAVLHSFGKSRDGGFYPVAGLIFDTAGNLYGVTYAGGVHGAGTAFELKPTAGGGWTEKVLHAFDDDDGYEPDTGLIFDASGNLYGNARDGIYALGTAFELKKPKAGRELDGEGAAQLRRRKGRLRYRDRCGPRCRRKSLRHDGKGRRSRRRYSI